MPEQLLDQRARALELGFAQGVHALQRTLWATPVGWLLVAWLAHGPVPDRDILRWVGVFALGWGLNLALLHSVVRGGCRVALHQRRVWAVACIDGVCWGLLVWLLMTHDRFLDAWLVVVLCGAVSVNVPTYITLPSAFRVLVAALWLTAAVSALALWPRLHAAPQLIAGLLVYFALLAYTVRTISVRVIDGIGLLLDNAALAERLREALTHMEHQATTDALTGQMNRRALDAALDRYVGMASSRGFRFSVLMLDIDHFKKINDSHGHNVGDQALRAVAGRVVAQLRVGDGCARFGGEEFVVLLPEASQAQAREIAERIREHIADGALPTEPPLWATASLGVAECLPGMSVEALLGAADGAVYVAKRSGRNRVCVADQVLEDLPTAGAQPAGPAQ